MSLEDIHYKHWHGKHTGIWNRRFAVAANGLKGCLQSKWMRRIITLCWALSLANTAVLFFIGQLLVTNSLAGKWIGYVSGPPKTFALGLVIWLEEHPEVSVRTTQNFLFYFFSTKLLTLSLIAIALAVPHLITRDLASNAIIVYSSKAINKFDYLLGKFAAVFGVLALTWLGPVCVSWLMGNMLAPHWHFFWHSRAALGNTLVYVLGGMVILSLMALGVSAISDREKTCVGLWLGLWLGGNMLAGVAVQTKQWLKFASLRFDLDQLSFAVFRLKNDMTLAQENIPVLGEMLKGVKEPTIAALQHPELQGAACGLIIMLLVTAAIVAKKVKPQ